MNKKLKNILMIVVLVILVIGNVFLIYSGSKATSSNMVNVNNNTNPNNNFNGATPPDKPSDNGMDNSDSKNDSPPEMPSNEENGERKDMPMGGGNAPSMPGDNNLQNDNMNNKNNLSFIYYVGFGVSSLGISLILIYLIMSRFNRKNFKETFTTSDKAIIYVLSSILLTIGTFYIDCYTVNKLLPTVNNDNVPGQMTNTNVSYSAALEITADKDITEGKYESTTKDENAILISGDVDVNIDEVTIEKSGDSDGGDSTSFYGTNSAILAKSGANVTIDNVTINTDATGANGVFSYGGSATTNNTSSDGTVVNISNSTITTLKDNSGGIMTTGGGTTNAKNLTILTSGVSSAAIRTDRGGGVVNVDGGSYETNGSGSPAIYSTAVVSVVNASLKANTAEGIVIEGENSVEIDNCDLVSNNTKLNGLSTTYKNIFLYQSMSGDAKEGSSSFVASNSNITTNKGDTIYVTNTTSTIKLSNNTIINNDSTGNFLRIKSDSWGNTGSNGGNVQLSLINQKVSGNIVVDNISTLDMSLSSLSYYEGIINGDNQGKSVKLTLDSNSTIKLMGDSYVTSLDNEVENNTNIDFNGYTLYVNGVAIN